VGPERVGPSVALGGVEPTLGDALIVLGHANYGDFNLASRALQDLADAIQAALQSNNINTSNNQLTLIKTASDVAKLILQNALETIQRGVDEVITVENKRPIYVVADIVNRLHAFYYSLEFGYPLSIQHKLEIGTAELIKLGSFNFEFNRTGDIMDFMSYIEVVDTLLSPMVYIMVNLDLVLNDDEINAFYHNMLSRQLRLVCLTTGSFVKENLEEFIIFLLP